MHEFGLASSVLDSVIAASVDAGAVAVLKVRLRVGVMTEAVEEALQFAWEALTDDTIAAGSVLEVNMVTPRSHCLDCDQEFDHDRYHMACPLCGSWTTELIAGKELYIESIDVDVPDEEERPGPAASDTLPAPKDGAPATTPAER